MLSSRFAFLCACALAWPVLGWSQAAKVRSAPVAAPRAVVTQAVASYCFARVRGLDSERQPKSFLELHLELTLAYRNPNARPLIVPLERVRSVFYALKPGQMVEYKEGLGLLEPSVKAMKDLPAGVNPSNPVDPKNDVFTVIPAGGEMGPLMDNVTLPVNRPGFFRKYPDLRGRKIYVELHLAYRELDAALLADLSDRWARFGVPWSGTLTTNTIEVDVPSAPKAPLCVDVDKAARPAVDTEDTK